MEFLVALLPSLGFGLLFYVMMRAIVHADRRERAAIAQLEAEEALKVKSDGETTARANGNV